jgi:GDPmannose 4,6-dehydratase
MRALVTGITGQDGTYLAERLLADGTEVVGLVRPPLAGRDLGPVLGPLRDRLALVEGDLRDPDGLRRAVAAAAPDELYHLAAPTFVPASWDDPAGALAEVAGATAVLLDAGARAGVRVLVATSPELFGDAGVSPQAEDAPRRPLTPYGAAKLAAHELVRVWRERRGAHACAAVTYNHESPRRPARFVTRKITRAAAAAARAQAAGAAAEELVLGDLGARRDWSHAADVVEGYVLAMRHPEPGDYVLGSGVARTVRDFVDAAWRAAGLDPAAAPVRVDPALVRPPERTLLVADPARARAVLGWRPARSFEQLVAEMVAADLERPA